MRRVLLAHLSSVRPSELEFIETGRQKPRLIAPECPIEFSCSHSGDQGIIVTGQNPVGVDMEALDRPLNHLEFAERCFADEEYADIRRASGSARRLAFFHCWTGKEAYLKALGVGLSKSLRSFSVRCAPDEPPGLRWDNDTTTSRSEYRFLRYSDDEHAVTVVLTDPAGAIEPTFHSLSPSSLRTLSPQGYANGKIWRPSP